MKKKAFMIQLAIAPLLQSHFLPITFSFIIEWLLYKNRLSYLIIVKLFGYSEISLDIIATSYYGTGL